MRGVTLRFLCNVKEVELLEPVSQAVRQCLDHKHPYVRRNAVLAVSSIYKNFDFLIPDAPELIFSLFLQGEGSLKQPETDPFCMRNAMAMLSMHAPDTLTAYLLEKADDLVAFDGQVQLVILEHIGRELKNDPAAVAIYGHLLKSVDSAVQYEAAVSIFRYLRLSGRRADDLSTHGVACLQTLVSLITSLDSNDNVKLIALQQISDLQTEFPEVVEEDESSLLDVLRSLSSSSDIQVQRLALKVVLQGVSQGRGEDVLGQLKRELFKLASDTSGNEYKRLYLDNINVLANRFISLAGSALEIFVSYLVSGESDYYSDQVTQYIKYGDCV